MNCSSDPNSSTSTTVRQSLLITYYLIGAMFLIFCVFPLFKLTRERLALYILISKLCPSLLIIFINILGQPLVRSFSVFLSQTNVQQNIAIFGSTSIRLHIIALAVNRAHAVLFPFHYSQKITKKFVLAQCVLIHLLSIFFTILAMFYPFIAFYTWPYLIVSSSFYVAIAIRLAWILAHKGSWGYSLSEQSSTSDKTSGRITATCFASQIQAWIYLLTNNAANYKWYTDFLSCHPIGQIVFYPLQLFASLYWISDEIFLLIICKDMRDLLARMIGKMFHLIITKKDGTKTAPGQIGNNKQILKKITIQNSNKMPVVQ